MTDGEKGPFVTNSNCPQQETSDWVAWLSKPCQSNWAEASGLSRQPLVL